MVRHPYLISAVVALAFFFVAGIAMTAVFHALHLTKDAPMRDTLLSFVSFMAGASAWEWLRPIRQGGAA